MKIMRSLAAALLLAAVGCGSDAPGGDDGLVTATDDMRSGAWFDVRWMEQMIDHHLTAVMMAEWCQDAGVPHAELLEFCEGIEAVQTAEIEDMRTWLSRYYGVTYAGSPSPMGTGMHGDGDLETLTGAAFEQEFMIEMIPHHEQAVHMSERCLARATLPQLRELCASIVTSQTAEIAQMQAWLCDWYDVCGYGGGMMGGGGSYGGGSPTGGGSGGGCGGGAPTGGGMAGGGMAGGGMRR